MKFKKIIIISLIIIAIIIISIYNIKTDTEEFISSEIYNETQDFINITNDENSEIKIYIIGEVNKPGVLILPYGARIEDAIISAGGPGNNADLSRVNLAYPLEDGQKIYIPSLNEIENKEYISSESGENVIEDPSNIYSNKKININKASLENLTSIPGIGESTAQKIIDYRNKNGNFNSIEDLKKVSGIGDKKYEKIRQWGLIF